MEHKIVTIFGGSGFVGRYVVKHLAKQGYGVQIVSRDPERANYLKTAGSVGQIVLTSADIYDEAAIDTLLKRTDLVINLTGILYQRGKQTFTKVHHDGPAMLAKLAKKRGVEHIVHVSALGVNKAKDSNYARSKFDGEKAIKKAFPDATILRPSVIFGPEDNFFNMFANMFRFMPFVPLIGGGHTKFQPVYVCDVAEAIATTLGNKKCFGKTYELGGPEIYEMKEIYRFILRTIKRRRLMLYVPFFAAKIKAFFLQLLPSPLLTIDQVRLLKYDNIVDKKALTLHDLGIRPRTIEAIVPKYLERFKRK